MYIVQVFKCFRFVGEIMYVKIFFEKEREKKERKKERKRVIIKMISK